MLEVLHLTKIYKTKGGAEVRALDDVSLRFPERGMIFLLGKSGSGKSTLLNVTGGLDAPTDGEIIVKGRSSKSFTAGDFDSYRNTFIGFIFQEYNILNEFTVEDNIALALELQGKPKDREAVAKILDDVDLTGYAKRKPNTLSGGQKQRIAIARALIKSPEIIMADEPTGALDSATGKQVFDTLKKLSRDKLVIIVSHDRDFAEQYADRIIELKDGKVLSDVSKTEEERQHISENVTAVGDTLTIKSGAELSEDDFKEIKSFLKRTERDVVIATGERDVKTFREAARITDDGGREVFRDTDGSEIAARRVFSPEESQFIRSKLPMRHAVKIGISGLKTKPIRLAFTALLCTVAFIMFGVLSTMMLYDSDATLKKTLTDSSLDMMSLKKEYKTVEKYYQSGTLTDEYVGSRYTYFTKDEIEEFARTYGSSVFGAIDAHASFSVQASSKYWTNEVRSFAYLEDNHTLLSKVVAGSYPDTSGEIMISSYMANVMLNCKPYDAKSGSPITVTNINELVGKSISLGGTEYTVSGIIESPELPAKFDVLKEDGTSQNYSLEYELERALGDSYYLTVFVTEDTLLSLAGRSNNFSPYELFENRYLSVIFIEKDGSYGEMVDHSNGGYTSYSDAAAHIDVFWLDGKTQLGEGEALLPLDTLYPNLYGKMNELLNEHHGELNEAREKLGYYELWGDFITDIAGENPDDDEHAMASNKLGLWENGIAERESSRYYGVYLDWLELWKSVENEAPNYFKYKKLCNKVEALMYGVYFEQDEKGNHIDIPLTDAGKNQLVDEIMPLLDTSDFISESKAQLYSHDSGSAYGDVYTFRTVGFYSLMPNLGSYYLILSDADTDALWAVQKNNVQWYSEIETNYVAKEGAVYSTVYIPFDRSDAAADSVIAIHNNKDFADDDSRITVSSTLIEGFGSVNSMITSMSQVFLWVGIVLAAFAALLLSNFISVSISQKKREIGILRAVGARGADVFKIFFSESFTIAAICTVISTVASIIVCEVLNAEISATIGSSLFVFGILSIVMLVAIALLTSVLATFLPVYNAAKKKPVESIRAL